MMTPSPMCRTACMGFANETLISRLYRDMRLPSIGGGADEVMLQILCKFMGTFPKVA